MISKVKIEGDKHSSQYIMWAQKTPKINALHKAWIYAKANLCILMKV